MFSDVPRTLRSASSVALLNRGPYRGQLDPGSAKQRCTLHRVRDTGDVSSAVLCTAARPAFTTLLTGNGLSAAFSVKVRDVTRRPGSREPRALPFKGEREEPCID